jgi:hypothetical protein
MCVLFQTGLLQKRASRDTPAHTMSDGLQHKCVSVHSVIYADVAANKDWRTGHGKPQVYDRLQD